jgi:phenylacetate-CoA ligase
MFTAIKYVEGYIRMLKAYGGSWRKSKIILIIDIKPGSVEHAAFTNSVVPFIKKFYSMDNIKYLHVGEKSDSLIREINDFNPEFLGSDPPVLMKIAILKNEGLGKDINLKYLFSSGSMLDNYSRQYVEKAFNAKLLDTYGATESGPVAFESLEGDGYHVNSDFVYLEFLDEEQKHVPYGKAGKLAVTRLYGKGTPIIRYTGMEDLITPIEPRTIRGMTTEMIKYIGGRSIELIYTPDGRMISPFHVTTIPASVMDDLKSYKIKQFQIIQHSVNKIEVLIIINEKLRNIGPSVKQISDEIIKRFKDVTSKDVDIVITEVDEIERDVRSDLVRLIVSKIKRP